MEDRIEDVFAQYDWGVNKAYRTRGAWILETSRGLRLLKNFEGKEKHLEFEHEVKEALFEQEFTLIDRFEKNKEQNLISVDSMGKQYFVKYWISGEECNLKELRQVKDASMNLGLLHKKMRNGALEEKRMYPEEKKLPFIFQKHNRELKRVFSYVKEKKQKNEFEVYFLSCFQEFYIQAMEALDILNTSEYEAWMKRCIEEQHICHGSYNYHNILFTKTGLFTTNFEKADIGLQVMDLYAFFRKVMEKNNWKLSYAKAIIEGYRQVMPLSKEEWKLFYILVLYPEKFWKVTNFYYNSKKSWISQRNTQKLVNIKEQMEQKTILLDEIKNFTNISL